MRGMTMYPKVYPVCNKPEQYANRGFEHVSMYLQGQGQGTLYLCCARCHNIFPWRYGDPEHATGLALEMTDPAAQATRPKRNSHAKVRL